MITMILNTILSICCEICEIKKDDVLNNSRKTEIIFCRKIFIEIVKEKSNLTNEKIGEFIGIKKSEVGYLYKKEMNNKYYTFLLNQIRLRIKDIEDI